MARKIRFPLSMKDGTEVRTIEELQEHFDLESVLGYFTDGKLKTWLEDRYYDEQAAAVGELTADMPDLNARLCSIFGIEHNDDTEVDLEEIQRRKKKLRILSAYTADKEILDNIDLVAMDQDDLFDILDMSPSTVYLFSSEFSIPLGKKNVRYIGINDATVKFPEGVDVSEYSKSNITFENIPIEGLTTADEPEAKEIITETNKLQLMNVKIQQRDKYVRKFVELLIANSIPEAVYYKPDEKGAATFDKRFKSVCSAFANLSNEYEMGIAIYEAQPDDTTEAYMITTDCLYYNSNNGFDHIPMEKIEKFEGKNGLFKKTVVLVEKGTEGKTHELPHQNIKNADNLAKALNGLLYAMQQDKSAM